MNTKISGLQDVLLTGRASQQKSLILQVISETPPLTRNELAERTGLRLSSVCGRVNELVSKGLLTSVGARRCTVTDRTCEIITTASTAHPQGDKHWREGEWREVNVTPNNADRQYEKGCVERAGVDIESIKNMHQRLDLKPNYGRD